jgi:multidrug resistance protein, MATE family
MATAPPLGAALSRRDVFAQAWPIIVGQALTPLVGVVDAAVIGRTGDAAALAGVALGASIINLAFWTFGFLRMGVTGLTAQAQGAGQPDEVAAILIRALALAGPIGLALLLLSPLITPIALTLMSVPAVAEAPARAFTMLRFFGAPAALGFYAINGWLIGLGRTRAALACQVALNGVNIVLDLVFVGVLHLGAAGVGLGTTLAEWSALAAGLAVATGVLGRSELRAVLARGRELIAWAPMRRLAAVNLDIMIRTLALLALFTWFARSGARLGAAPLAANHVLMQFVSISAYVLDGFAFTAEHRVGAAAGAGSKPGLLRAIRLTGEFSLAGGAFFALLIAAAGPFLIDLLVRDAGVRLVARAMLPYCALVPLVGVPSWLLDGIFIGAVRGRTLRNAAIVATAAYLLTDAVLRRLGDAGVWLALLSSYLYRAAALGVALPGLLRRVEARV